ncbi:hypothetical protein AB0G83_22625 [Streptomyces klenkii]
MDADTRTVDGSESLTTSKVVLPLTVEQAEAFGLPEPPRSAKPLWWSPFG